MSEEETRPLLGEDEALENRNRSRRWRLQRWIAIIGSGCFISLLVALLIWLAWRRGRKSETPVENIKWEACGDNLYNSRLDVPLDYDDPSIGTASLYLVKYAYTSQKRLGTIFINPGGPGSSGSRYIWATAKAHNVLTGGDYDIVGWDPRGVNMSTPRATCFSNALEEAEWQSNLPIRYELPSSLPGAPDISQEERRARFEEQLGGLLESMESLAGKCYGLTETGGIWDYMDSASNARDLARMTDVLDGPGAPINYRGYSYGTLLGQYLINIFPDRVGRVIIDGPGYAARWANTPNYKLSGGWFGNTEDALEEFFKRCAEAGDICALAKDLETPTAGDIRQKVDSLIVDLQDKPRLLPIQAFGKSLYLTQSMITDILFAALFAPRNWPGAAETIQSTISGDPIPAFLSVEEFPSFPNSSHDAPASTLPFAEFGVECSDTLRHGNGVPTERSELVRLLAQEKMYEVDKLSTHFGGVNTHPCGVWPVSKREKKSFRGPWNHTLANEIIIIGITADPVSPQSETRKLHSVLEGQSRLIWQHGFGHCSPSQASICTAQRVRDFFTDGKLPPRESTCEVSDPSPWESVTKGASNVIAGGLEAELLEAMSILGEFQ
ncbi:hypothetical protein BCR39DRAFT_544153 [Naematelia encephala]|uniref:Alpha/beta-hydrolase n=1 Tax=Naematelia encephala TaxID=71784 RepID=A0A1Y2ASL3_9TREE|nr:hypothetical protein BCR39DRAFT_544153 [Naematelia encephala]